LKEIKGKTLVKLDIEEGVQLINGQAFAYQEKKIGSLIALNRVGKDNAGSFDPIFGEVVVGDNKGKTAWFHKLNYKEAVTYGNQNHLLRGEDIDEPEGLYLLIESSSIFFYTDSDNNIEVVEDWTLCEPIDDVTWEYVDGIKIKCRKTTGGLIVPAMKEEYKTGKAVLRHIHPSAKEEFGLCEGDIVYLDRACDLPVEDELNMKLGKMYFRVEVCNIIGVEPDSNNDELNRRWNELQPALDKIQQRLEDFFVPKENGKT
jgi:hypothetical protein